MVRSKMEINNIYNSLHLMKNFRNFNDSVKLDFRFPASQFATLYGLGIFIGGTFGVLQYALFELTSGPFHGDPLWVSRTKPERNT